MYFLSALILPLFFACKKESSTPTLTPTPTSNSYFIKATLGGTLWQAYDGQNVCSIPSSNAMSSDSQTSTLVASFGAGFDQDAMYGTITTALNGSVDTKQYRFKWYFQVFKI
ncbi:MAG: hypothetical protein HYR91_06925 [Flavobacteriia bacterium]|nr:hypothetical protein [Flavobacteriia bacterium]